MQSAFGIDHGEEIAKFGLPSAAKVGMKVSGLGRKAESAGVMRSAMKGGQGGVKGTLNQVAGYGQAYAGRGLRHAGIGISRHPKLAAGAALGAAGAGAAGTGYAMGRKKQY